jgi:hypothetical protein
MINKRVPIVLTYHSSLEKISGIVRHHWKGIEKSETLAKLFPERFAIDIANDLILLSCCLTMEHLCVLQLETALATLVATWFTLADGR